MVGLPGWRGAVAAGGVEDVAGCGGGGESSVRVSGDWIDGFGVAGLLPDGSEGCEGGVDGGGAGGGNG